MKATHWIKTFSLSLLIAGCTANSQDRNETAETKAPTLPVATLTTQATDLHRAYVGDIHAVRNVEIFARVKGYLEKVYVDEGQPVKKGQLLFLINDEEYKSDFASAKANLQSAIAEAKAAELEVDRVRLLVDKKVISKTELEVAQAKLAALNARIAEARSAQTNAAIRLAHTHIKAPFDGIVDRIPQKVGSLIDEGTRLTTVSDIHTVYAYFNVSENEYLEYMKTRDRRNAEDKGTVELILADGTPYAHPGKIETMEGQFDAGTGSIAFRASFPNPNQLLKHGSTGTVRLTNTVQDALIVPQKATFEIQDKSYVYVVDQHNQVRMKSFRPRTRVAHYYVVESGLKPGEKIVYEGVQSLRDGLKINPQYISMDSLELSSAKPVQAVSVSN